MVREKDRLVNIREIIRTLIILSVIGFAMIFFRVVNQGSIRFAFLVWNLFLAWIPFSLSLMINYINRDKKYGIRKYIYLSALGFLWLIFYPNAPYVVTDIIHLSNYNYYGGYNFNSSFIIWYDFILVMLFVFISYILGHISLFIIHKIIEKKYNRVLGWIFVSTVSILSGFAIYLGRFLRFNSWEIITNPVSLLGEILADLNIPTLKFTVMFGAFIFSIYILIYNLSFLKKE